jgi:gamma-glutamyl phosphate reductase
MSAVDKAKKWLEEDAHFKVVANGNLLIRELMDEIMFLRAEIEQLRVQLAGCGVVAKCNTETSRAKQKCEQGDYGWSQSYQDVSNAVDREIKLRYAIDTIHDYTVRHHGGLGRLHDICDSALGHDK